MNYNLITLLGPTATGKTKLGVRLANKFNGEIISADSRQVYRGMDLGTGKDLGDYVVDGKNIQYYLIDIVDPRTEFNLFSFTIYFKDTFKQILSRNKIPFLVGGTGLYISSVIQDYKLKKADFSKEQIQKLAELSLEELRLILLKLKPNLHNKTDLENKDRIIKAILVARSEDKSLMNDVDIKSLVIGLRFDRSEIKKRISERLRKRLNEGMIDEVVKLNDSGVSYDRLLSLGLEYKFITLYLKGELNYDEMFSKLNSAIAAFAKRQMTWFRKMEREGVKINWIDNADFEVATELISKNNFASNLMI